MRRKSLKRPDDFMVALQRFFDGLAKNTRLMVTMLVVFLLAGVAATLLYNKREERSDAAKNALFVVEKELDAQMKTLAAAMVPPPPAPPADANAKDKDVKKATPPAPSAEAIAFKKLDVDAKLSEGIKKLEAVIHDFKGTRSAYEAQLALGDLYFNHGDSNKAIPWYQQAAESAPNRLEQALSYSSIGYALENSGKPTEAIQAFQKAINLGEANLKGDMLLGIARCSEALHDTAKARSTYDEVIAQFPNTEYAKSAEYLKSQLQ